MFFSSVKRLRGLSKERRGGPESVKTKKGGPVVGKKIGRNKLKNAKNRRKESVEKSTT